MENPYIREMLILDRQQTLLQEAARWRAGAHLPGRLLRETVVAALIALAHREGARLAPSVGGQAGGYRRSAISK